MDSKKPTITINNISNNPSEDLLFLTNFDNEKFINYFQMYLRLIS